MRLPELRYNNQVTQDTRPVGEQVQIKDKVREDDGNAQELVLTVTASAEEVDAAADRFFKEIAQREIPGFRKGKAPRSVLEQNVGGHANAMGGVAETLINELAFGAIDGADVIFLGEPQFNVDKMLEEGKPFTFTVSGPVAPQMKLADYGPVAIEMPPEQATDAEVEAQIEALRDYYHSLEDIEDEGHVAAMGDYANLVLTVTNHGRLVSGMRETTRLVGLGEGTMPASFDEKIIGVKVGDKLEFDFEAKDEEGGSEYGDGELHAEVEVKGFRRMVLPEVDDALASKVGCTDVADMRKQMTYTINEQKSRELPKLMVDRAIDALIERLDGEVPGYYVDFIRQDVGRELMQGLQQQGTNLQQWMLENSINGDDMKEDVAREAARRAAIDCALEALFVEKGMEVTDEDIAKMFANEEDPEATLQQWKDANRMADIHKMCRHTKATEWLVDNADVTVVED